MTPRQKKIISDNLNAFIANFGDVRIEQNGGFYVYYPADGDNDSWIQYCYNIDYLNGWLYGVVQGVNRMEFRKDV